MGQKTNPNILRLGKIKEWKSKYIEKKSTESAIVIFRDLEIKKFLSQLFAINKLKIQNFRVYYSENSLHVYISYYSFFKPSLVDRKTKQKYTNLCSNAFQNKILNIKKKNLKKQLYIAKIYKKIFSHQSQLNLFQTNYLLNKRTQRLDATNNLKIYKDITNHNTLNHQRTNLFVSKILKSLMLFTNKKHNIFLNLKQVNKETTFFQTISKKNKHKLKKDVTKLRKFQQNEFFKEGFNVLNAFAKQNHSSSFLAEFIAIYLKKLKRPTFFLRFLKIALKTLTSNKSSNFERIQIKIKGRFNGAPRSRHKFINISRNIPILTLNSKIDYGEAVAYTLNGTFGIKVWTYIKH